MRSRSQSTSPHQYSLPTRTTGKNADLAGLDERERLEQLVERPESARQHDERARVAHEHDLAREEVVEVDARGRRTWFIPCSNGRSMVRPTDRAPASRAPRLAASIAPGPAAGDDAEARLAERAADLARQLVARVVARRARRAEHRDAALDAPQRGRSRARAPRAMRSTRCSSVISDATTGSSAAKSSSSASCGWRSGRRSEPLRMPHGEAARRARGSFCHREPAFERPLVSNRRPATTMYMWPPLA